MHIPSAIRRGASRLLRLRSQWGGWPVDAASGVPGDSPDDPPGLSRPRIERVSPELDLVVLPGVFPPARCFTTRALLEALDRLEPRAGGVALDMGTGSGAAAVHLARRGFRVDAVDINPWAVRCARTNAMIHGQDSRISVYRGDLFEPVRGKRYDVIVFNPPYLYGTPTRWLEHAFYGGPHGEVMWRFLEEAPSLLAPGGQVVWSWSTVADSASLEARLDQGGWSVRELHRRDLIAEVITHLALTPSERLVA